MRKIRHTVSKSRFRVLNNELLPFDVPLIFSNKHFYQYMVDNNAKYIEREDSLTLTFESEEKAKVAKASLYIILPLEWTMSKIERLDIYEVKVVGIRRYIKSSTPYFFEISHKLDKSRRLAVIHPGYQLLACNIYEDFKYSIVEFCRRSSFSLRAPYKVAQLSFLTIKQRKSKVLNRESASRKNYPYVNYFKYNKYMYLWKYFDDKVYYKLEMNFRFCLQLDIQSCFDSIYTHSISWAILGKQYVKENMDSLKKNNKFLGTVLDNYFMNINYSETNGIIIGPEFSRIFAEIILQKVDVEVEKRLIDNKSNNPRDQFDTIYSIHRYVDNYYVYGNNELILRRIEKIIAEELSFFRLSLNSSKRVVLVRPFIENLSCAKIRLRNYFSNEFVKMISDKDQTEYWYPNFPSANKVIDIIRSTVLDYNLELSQLCTFILTFIEGKTKKINKFLLTKSLGKHYAVYYKFYEMTELVVNYISYYNPKTAFVTRLISLKSDIMQSWYRVSVSYCTKYKTMVHLNAVSLLKESMINVSQIEYLNYFILLKECDSNLNIPIYLLEYYFRTKFNKYESYSKLRDTSYFQFIVLMYIVRDLPNYRDFKDEYLNKILLDLKIYLDSVNNKVYDSEICLLIVDWFACPYVPVDFKSSLRDILPGDFKKVKKNAFNSENMIKFVDWGDPSLLELTLAKRNHEVY